MMNVLYLLSQVNVAAPNFRLTAAGWFTMLASVGFVTLLLSWCVYRVLHTPGPGEHLHSQADIDPHDRED